MEVLFGRRRLSLLATVFALSSVAMCQATPPPAADQSVPHGKVLFSRDQDSAAAEKAARTPDVQPVSAVTDAERDSLTFTAYDLDVHLTPAQSQLATHAGFTVKNSGTVPLTRLIFQISSSLHWQSFAMRNDGQVSPLSFTVQTIDTDADHTGKATEAVVSLPQPLLAGASLALTSFYSGEVTQSAERLERIGAPADAGGPGRLGPDRSGADRRFVGLEMFCGIRRRRRQCFWEMERSFFRASGRPSCSRPLRWSVCGSLWNTPAMRPTRPSFAGGASS